MSNAELILLTVGALGLHLLTLGVAILRRRPKAIVRVVLIFSAAIIFLLAFNLRWNWPPMDAPLLGFGALELAIAAAAITAMLRRYRWAIAATWTAFGLHTLLSALAVAFAVLFKISRLM